jgi:hypothetical protein
MEPDNLRRTANMLAQSFNDGGETECPEWVSVAIEQLHLAAAEIEQKRAEVFIGRLRQIIDQNGVIVFDHGFNEYLIYDDSYTLQIDVEPIGRGETLAEAIESVRILDE